jgi:hypothetical protein
LDFIPPLVRALTHCNRKFRMKWLNSEEVGSIFKEISNEEAEPRPASTCVYHQHAD